MSLVLRIQKDFTEAFKARDAMRTDTLRLLRSALHNREIEKRGRGLPPVLAEDEALLVVKQEVKKRREAGELYVRGGREELAKKELAELAILETYMPEQMSEEAMNRIVDEVLAEFPGATQKDFGKIMGAAVKKAGNAVSGKALGDSIRAKLSG